MSQSSPIEPFNEPAVAIADYRQQAREFLVRSRQYLADDDLHQASEKGWGAAAWMAKAVAEAQGWQYKRHEEFADILNRTRNASGDERLRDYRRVANELHGYFYTRKRFLDSEDIGNGLDRIAELLDILEPLTETS
ncbi:MAG: hypothetical protein OXL37_01535 [Chloroflexota bacterium]|nr:hypothetical protein [Chloroflexota bacterium]MDE2961286.1 hypothetical protein [Chloroflexota bacterium]